MSQSRNRRPAPRAREPPRAAAPPANHVTSEAKENYGNKNTYKIPKSVRYDLENALVGLCDIWFEEIKPHLVKNKVKLHTGGALNEDMEPPREHRSSHEKPRRAPRPLLDPGAASDIRRPEVSCRPCSPTRPAASRARCPSPRPLSPSRPMPLSPNNFRKLLQLPDEKSTRQPAKTTRAPPPLTQTYQRDARILTNQWMRPPVQETPLRQPSPPFTRTRTHQQKDQHTPEQRAANTRKQPPRRRPTRSHSPTPTPLNTIYQKNDHNVLNQDNRKTRKNKKIRKPQPSLSQQPPRQVLRPCCTACALAANAQTANIPRRPLAATRLPPPRTKNTLPSKPPLDKNMANNKLRRFDVKIPDVSYPTQKPIASTLPEPPRLRISPAGDVPQSSQYTAGNSAFLQESSGIRNVFVRNPSQHIHSINNVPVPPKFGKNFEAPLLATNISPAGDVPQSSQYIAGNSAFLEESSGIRNVFVRNPSQHIHSINNVPVPPKFGKNLQTPLRATNISPAGDVTSFPHVAIGNSLNVRLQDSTRIPNPIARKPSQNHSANTVHVPTNFERNWPSPRCGTKISPAVGPSSLHDVAGDSPQASDFAGIRKSLDAVSTAPLPSYFRGKLPCTIRGVGNLQSPAHAKCMTSAHGRNQSPVSSAQARSQSPVSSPISPPPFEDEIWFHRVFKEDMTRRRRTIERIKENSVLVHDICTSSSRTTPIYEESSSQNECNQPLFSKDLIDLIGDKNDERLRVLYENPARHESQPSVLHLVGSRNKKRKTAPKKMPWR